MELLLEERCSWCLKVFFLCPSCYQGQSYCGPECREAVRQRVARAAQARHQRSEEGRLDHRDRQRAYRQRMHQRTSMAGEVHGLGDFEDMHGLRQAPSTRGLP